MGNKSKGITVVDNTNKPHGVSKLLFNQLGAKNYIESGSLGLKCCFVAEGVADVFVKDVAVRDWDIAPAYLILQESGGEICLPSCSNYIFDGPMEKPEGVIVASNKHLLNQVCEITININIHK